MAVDHQKNEAKRSLWDCDGDHIRKSFRNKSRGRQKELSEIRRELVALAEEPLRAHEEQMGEEIDEALYCYSHGPCAACVCQGNS